jgi:hypothetical protein
MTLKVFDLVCENGHSFEGWFRCAEDYETQNANKLIDCPVCASKSIRKTLSAPYVATGAAPPAPVQKPQTMPPPPAQMQAAVLKMVREMVANTEDVGARVAQEARRIHYQEAEERGIRGVAPKDDAVALEEEGIDVMPKPFAAMLKEPLQ